MGKPIHLLANNTPITSVSSDKGKEEDVFLPISPEKEPLEVAPIDTLPVEILAMIFQLATNNGKDPNTLCRMREVNRLWHQLIEGTAEDEDLYRYGLLSSLWNKLKAEIQHPFLKERIFLIDRSVSWIIALPDGDSCDEESVLFLDSTHFSHFQDLSRELTGAPRLLGFSAAPYEDMQRDLDTSLEQIWPLIQAKIKFARAPIPDNAQAIREWLNNPANAEKIACITWLDLTYRNLKVLPPEIGHFSQLKTLNLDFNQLSSLPLALNNLSILKTLTLRNNSFSFFPQVIYSLSQLTILSLHDNQLSSLPQAIGNLSQLQHLNLSKNNLSSFPPTFTNLTQLETFLINNNQFSSLPSFIGNFTQLTVLGLNSNSLSSLPSTIGNLSQLTVLGLDFNSLSSLPSTIGNLIQLQELDLRSNQLSSLPATIANLTQLQKLDLQHNLLSSLPPIQGHPSLFTILANPLLCILKKGFLPIASQSPTVGELQAKSSAYLNYVCRTPLASLCQEILRASPDDVLRNAFEKLSDEGQQRIRQHGSTIPSSSSSSSEKEENLFADRSNFAKAVIASMQKQWEGLSPKEVNLVYAQFAILAGELMENLKEELEEFGSPPLSDQELLEARQKLQTMWGQDRADENIMRLIDAMELVTQK